jgi:micrococcal nuclease
MLKLFFLLGLGLSAGIMASAQVRTIPAADAAKHVGDSVTVCDKVYSARWLENAKNQPTFLNLGEAYPNQLLTVVIWENVRKSFGYKPEEKLMDKKVCVTGKIEEFRGKPQIVLHQAAQLKEE